MTLSGLGFKSRQHKPPVPTEDQKCLSLEDIHRPLEDSSTFILRNSGNQGQIFIKNERGLSKMVFMLG